MLQSLFNPKNIAVIGASSKDLHIGNRIIKNLLDFGYNGNIFPINPKAKYICGIKAFKSILEIDNKIDTAHIVIPAKFVPIAIEECGIKGVKNVIINSGGFAEVGSKGEKLQKNFLKIAKKYNVRVLGPNCQGIINSDSNIKAYCNFTFTFPEPGNISIISLSGGVGELIHQNIVNKGVGTRIYVSSGNSCDISVEELIKYIGQDELTKVLVIYLEGLKNLQNFIKEAKNISLKKPILAMKAGKTKEGAKAAASHTGSIINDEISYDLIFKKSGILSFDNEKDLINAAILLGSQPLPNGNKVGIITNTGGPAVIASDALIKYGFKINDLSDNSTNILRNNLHKGSSVQNPVDLLATGTSKHYKLCLKIMAEDKNVDIIFVIFVTPFFVDAESIAKEIGEMSKKRLKPIICNLITDKKIWKEAYLILKKNNVPCFSLPTEAAKSLLSLKKYKKIRNIHIEKNELQYNTNITKTSKIIDLNKINKNNSLPTTDVYNILQNYGINVPPWEVTNDSNNAMEIAKKIGYPVVVKIDSDSVIHKSDLGGVILNLSNDIELEKTISQLSSKFGKKDYKSKFLIQKYLPGFPEFVLGTKFVKEIGHTLMFGIGGIFVEVLKDVSFELMPITKLEAKNLVYSIKNKEILYGIRGNKPVNIDLLIDLIQRLAILISDFPNIYELDFNPVVYSNNKVIVLDARIFLKN